jgi:hypothetical protein
MIRSQHRSPILGRDFMEFVAAAGILAVDDG